MGTLDIEDIQCRHQARSTESHRWRWGRHLRAVSRKSDDGGDTSESEDVNQMADDRATPWVSGVDSSAVTQDDQDAWSSRAVDSEHLLGQHKTSTGARASEMGPVTSSSARGSSESAVSSAATPATSCEYTPLQSPTVEPYQHIGACNLFRV